MSLHLRAALCQEADHLTDIKCRAKATLGHDAVFMEEFRKSNTITPVHIASQLHIVADIEGQIVGFAVFRFEESILWIDDLCVDPDQNKKAVSSALIERLSDFARQYGCLSLQVEANATIESLFTRNGFQTFDHVPSKAAGRYVALMRRDGLQNVLPVRVAELKIKQRSWDFSRENRHKIEAHWRTACEKKPALFNGDVYQLYDWTIEGGLFRGVLSKIGFADFLAWRDWGYPDRTVNNLFGTAVIRSTDGTLIFGRMASQTANAGKIYPPGGSLDNNDIIEEDKLDIFGSIGRELKEETGLDARKARIFGIYAVFDGARIALALCLDFKKSAAELQNVINHHIGEQIEPELSGVVQISSPQDIDRNKMPSYAVAIAEKLFSASPQAADM
ncbi:MAG: GNAT family N-acetyltransferase [Stappiaceae bacterium]